MQPHGLLSEHFRLVKQQAAALKKLGVLTVRDLLYHFPARYGESILPKSIAELAEGDTVLLRGRITKLEKTMAFRKRIPLTRAELHDASGKIRVVWFHQPYLATMLREGAIVDLKGKVTKDAKGLYLANPQSETAAGAALSVAGNLLEEKASQDAEAAIQPVYPESRGITSRWFFYALKKLLAQNLHKEIGDPIPEAILQKYNLPTLHTALVWIHEPRKIKDAEAARKRFAFEEIFFLQIARQYARRQYRSTRSFSIKNTAAVKNAFVSRLPFALTAAQERVIDAILADFEKPMPMSRLLEGDVGSGKTAVAAAAIYSVVNSHPEENKFAPLQAAVMAPTEILAKQHFESFTELFSHLPIQIGLVTRSGCRKFPSKTNPREATSVSRAQLMKWIAGGEIALVIGTHALIQKTVRFKNLAHVVIDEQHRFGTMQRYALIHRTMRTERGLDAEKEKILYKDITYKIRESLFHIKKELGSGHKEIVYQKALVEEFNYRKLGFNREVHIPILYRNKQVGTYVPDFVIEDKVILELKSIPFLGAKEKRQLWTYLKGSEYKLGLLVNFGTKDLEIARVIYDTARDSASSPHSSAFVPHLLSMTATPIPRTLALTIYGDLDLSLLDEMPPGRKPVITKIVPPMMRGEAYEEIRAELGKGRQAYVICPKIDVGEGKLEVKNVTDEAARLKKKVFPEYEIAILHSRLKPKEREEVMERFLAKKINILVSTSVIEVGVNVPNATVIAIEGAERFGLAQLHQFRGRVLRSTTQAYCYLFGETRGKNASLRLRALEKASSGFDLAELDLKMRGPGELSGRKQWGISDLGMEAIKNIKMVEAARAEATRIIEEDPKLSNYPLLKERMERADTAVHLE